MNMLISVSRLKIWVFVPKANSKYILKEIRVPYINIVNSW